MKRQKDWYTGINHYHNCKEKEITITQQLLKSPVKQQMHQQVEMIYIFSGKGRIRINGEIYEAYGGCLFCLYPHHFYEIFDITEGLDTVAVKFYIGLFMYMSWEKHPQNANAKLVYDTKPVICLQGAKRQTVELLLSELLWEKRQKNFEYTNMIIYKTLELHAYYCRYAFESIGSENEVNAPNPVWDSIIKTILASGNYITLPEAAEGTGYTAEKLNREIKRASGYTFFQLQRFGKMLNACALLHFPELSLEYISGLCGFPNIPDFFRVFKQYIKMTPREYQTQCVTGAEPIYNGSGIALQILQYLHLHFMEDVTFEALCRFFCLKPYSVEKILEYGFGTDLDALLGEIRISYACAFLKSTDKSIQQIAEMTGFQSASTFYRHFKKWMEESPSAYRRT